MVDRIRDDRRRRVLLDPDGHGGGWMFVVVAAPTGVVYQNQGGGHSCALYEQEGYLLPLFGTDLDAEFEEIFVGELHGWGMCGEKWAAELLDRLRAAIGSLGVYGADRHEDLYPTALILDESRLPEAAEAWIPVLSGTAGAGTR
ncbi:DUF6210 family protein [Embleya sp. NPDC005575]|uniref:DUF6210 family protein n=1 Tax=Embleya sp. NPDC005575 TaxID=3156892 RepID=UPI0033AA3066